MLTVCWIKRQVLPNLPWLFEDETLYSWCGRVHAWSCCNSSIATSRKLFGAPYSALCHDFPSHVDDFSTRILQWGADPAHIALNHTLLGYYLVSQSKCAADEILAKVRRSSLPSMKMKLGITASRVGGHHPLKACPECIANDVKSFGSARWRLNHQYPSVLVCALHARPLFIAWDPVSPVHRRFWLNPTDSSKWTRIDIPISDDEQFGKLIRLANFTESWAKSGPGSFDQNCLASAYRSGLCQRGLATVSGSLRLRALVAEARRKYLCIQDLPGFEALRSVTPDWPGLVAALSRKKPRNGHPLKHLLLIALIFDSWDDFLNELRESDRESDEPEVLEDDAPRQLTEKIRTMMLEKSMSASAAGALLGVSKQVAIGIAFREGMPIKRKPKKLHGPLLREVVSLVRKGLPLKDIALQSGIARITVNRMISSDPDLAQAWKTSRYLILRKQMRLAFLKTIGRHPDAAVKQIRLIPGNGYMWLYRHDKAWLKENLPAMWSKERV